MITLVEYLIFAKTFLMVGQRFQVLVKMLDMW